MKGCRIILFFLILLPQHLLGQVNRYVVFFNDKAGTPFTIDQPLAFLSQKAIDRRTRQGIAITAEDLPVDPAYVAQVKATGARTFYTSRWMNCLLVEIGADSLGMLTALPFVSGVEMAAPGHQLPGGRTSGSRSKRVVNTEPASATQLHQLGIDEMHNRGFRGETITIAVLDAGFEGVNVAAPFAALFQNGQIKGTYDFVGKSGNVYQYDDHGTEVLSVMGASMPGSFMGGAPQASFYLFVTEDVPTEYRIEEYNWLWAAEKADSVGADIINGSLGYNEFDDALMNYQYADLDGKTAVVTRAAVFALQRGMVVVCSAGNEGTIPWQYITPPADAEGILSCGAVTVDGIHVPFSSIGPTSDNRIKPDVSALGYGVSVILPGGTTGAQSGTSFSSPLVSSLAAGVWQAFPGLKSGEVYEVIIQSADQALNPDNTKGYGIPNFVAVSNYLENPPVVDVSIYPNPVAESNLHVQLREPVEAPIVVTVIDRLGRILSEASVQSTWANNPIIINVSNMTSGLYLLKLNSPTFAKTFRWIKE